MARNLGHHSCCRTTARGVEREPHPRLIRGIRGLCLAVSVVIAAILWAAGNASDAAAAPRNDHFAQAATLRVGTSVNGAINGATAQRGEPRHANSIADHSVWYQLRSKRKRAVGLDTCKSNFDTLLAVYSGRSLRSLKEVEFNNDACGAASEVIFTARPGRTYHIAVAGFVSRGKFTLRARKVDVPPNDDFADAVALTLEAPIVATTGNATRELREPRHGAGAAHTVWFRLSVQTAGTIGFDACNGYSPSLTFYTGRRVDALTRVAGGYGCRHRLDVVAGRTYRIVAESSGGGGSFRLTARAVSG
jgi:hypothetical protein